MGFHRLRKHRLEAHQTASNLYKHSPKQAMLGRLHDCACEPLAWHASTKDQAYWLTADPRIVFSESLGPLGLQVMDINLWGSWILRTRCTHIYRDDVPPKGVQNLEQALHRPSACQQVRSSGQVSPPVQASAVRTSDARLPSWLQEQVLRKATALGARP